MKALVLQASNQLEFLDWPSPEPGPGDVLVRVKACGICGSDVHGLDGSTGRRQPPVIMGHEASGVIAGAGSGVKGWSQADRVTFDSTFYCGTCSSCCQGRINLCEQRRVLGVSCDDYRHHGAFAEYVAVPAHLLHRLPDAVTFEQAAMVEPMSVALHAVRRSDLRGGETAVVIGAGMVGMFVVQCLRALGYERVIAVDIDRDRLELAAKLGASLTLDAEDLGEQIADYTQGRGADLAFEVVGVTSTLQTAIECVTRGGRIVLVGNIAPRVELPLQEVVTGELTLVGTCASAGEIPECLELLASGRVDADALCSAAAPLSDGASWFQRIIDKEPGLMKVILKP